LEKILVIFGPSFLCLFFREIGVRLGEAAVLINGRELFNDIVVESTN
jgi:hypothetical protein